MSIRHAGRTTKVALASVAGLATLGLGGAAYAATTPSTTPASIPKSSPAPSSGGASSAPAGRLRRRGLLARSVHAELVIRTAKGYKTVDYDRGSLTSVSTTSVTLTRPDGPTVTEKVAPTTRFRGEAESQLTPGTKVVVISSGGTAMAVLSRATGTSPTPSSDGATSSGA